MSNEKHFNFSQIVYFFLCTLNFKYDIFKIQWDSAQKILIQGGNTLKKYLKPVLELKVVTPSSRITSGLDGWITDNNLSDVGITKTVLTLDANS